MAAVVNAVDDEGYTALHEAAGQLDAHMVRSRLGALPAGFNLHSELRVLERRLSSYWQRGQTRTLVLVLLAACHCTFVWPPTDRLLGWYRLRILLKRCSARALTRSVPML